MSFWQSLSVFGAVVEEGSFSGAAKKLDLTQPTVSFHIDNLEKNFGCSLFQRTSRGVTLTVYGKTLLNYTSKINVQLEEAHNHIRAMIAGSAGKITFGASTIPAEYIIPALVAEFLRDRTDLQFSMRTGDTQTIMAGFSAGNYPIAIVGSHPGDNYKVMPLWQDEMVLIAHPETAARLGKKPALAELLSQPFVTRGATSASMRSVYTALENLGVSTADMRIVLQVGGNEALKSAVLNKLGLAFISKWAVRDELQAGKLVKIDLPNIKIARQFYAVCREPLIPACFQLFWDFLSSHATLKM